MRCRQKVKKVLGKPFSSTMCTGNLRSGMEYFYQAISHHSQDEMKKCFYYLFINSAFILGVILGGWITNIMIEKAILICLFPIVIVTMFKCSINIKRLSSI